MFGEYTDNTLTRVVVSPGGCGLQYTAAVDQPVRSVVTSGLKPPCTHARSLCKRRSHGARTPRRSPGSTSAVLRTRGGCNQTQRSGPHRLPMFATGHDQSHAPQSRARAAMRCGSDCGCHVYDLWDCPVNGVSARCMVACSQLTTHAWVTYLPAPLLILNHHTNRALVNNCVVGSQH